MYNHDSIYKDYDNILICKIYNNIVFYKNEKKDNRLLQGSRWILQGILMNGKIDFLNWTLKPDQIHLINPLFILIFIPLFNTVVYPILYKIGVNSPLQKITIGGIFAALSFVCAAAVQYTINVSICNVILQYKYFNSSNNYI